MVDFLHHLLQFSYMILVLWFSLLLVCFHVLILNCRLSVAKEKGVAGFYLNYVLLLHSINYFEVFCIVLCRNHNDTRIFKLNLTTCFINVFSSRTIQSFQWFCKISIPLAAKSACFGNYLFILCWNPNLTNRVSA